MIRSLAQLQATIDPFVAAMSRGNSPERVRTMRAPAQAPMAIPELAIFPVIALAGLVFALRLLHAVQEQPAGTVAALRHSSR